MRFHTILAVLLLAYFPGFTQGKRYVDPVFERVSRTRNLNYDPENTAKSKRSSFDIYQPDGDSSKYRPLLILMHGGGFRFGSKNVSRMKIWGKQFARKGYVVVAINYRKNKGKPLSRFADLSENCAEATEDLGKATAWLRAHAGQFRLDTNLVIFGGHSAGGMIALHAVYASPQEIQLLVEKGDTNKSSARIPSLNHNRYRAAAIVNFWGAIYDTSWLRNANTPIVSVHGSRDRVVPPDHKDAPIFGSIAIHRAAVRQGTKSSLKIYEGKGHELQRNFNPLYAGPVARRRWREAADFAARFLSDNLIK